MRNIIVINGIAYDGSEENLTESTEKIKREVSRLNREVGTISENFEFSHEGLIDNIATGFVAYGAGGRRMVYSFQQKVRMPTTQSNFLLEVITPKVVIVKVPDGRNPQVYAGVYSKKPGGIKYPFSNAFSQNIITRINNVDVSVNHLCLGRNLESSFSTASISRIPCLVESIFTSYPNNDLRLLSAINPTSFERFLRSALVSGKITLENLSSLLTRYSTNILRAQINLYDRFNYDVMLCMASAVSTVVPQLINEFWENTFSTEESARDLCSEDLNSALVETIRRIIREG